MLNLDTSMGTRIVSDRLESRVGDVAEMLTQTCWRSQGYIVAPMLGKSAPLCDMMISDRKGKSFVVEVKATTTSVFSIGRLPKVCHRVYVFVHFRQKENLKMKKCCPGEFDCYILTSKETKSVWKARLGRNGQGGIRLVDILKFKDQWSKPFEKTSRKSSVLMKIYGEKMTELYPIYHTKSGKLRSGRKRSSYVRRAWREAKEEYKENEEKELPNLPTNMAS